jgi:hypothetical protein
LFTTSVIFLNFRHRPLVTSSVSSISYLSLIVFYSPSVGSAHMLESDQPSPDLLAAPDSATHKMHTVKEADTSTSDGDIGNLHFVPAVILCASGL